MTKAVAGNTDASEAVVAMRFWQRIGVDILRGSCRAFHKRLADKSIGEMDGGRAYQRLSGLVMPAAI